MRKDFKMEVRLIYGRDGNLGESCLFIWFWLLVVFLYPCVFLLGRGRKGGIGRYRKDMQGGRKVGQIGKRNRKVREAGRHRTRG